MVAFGILSGLLQVLVFHRPRTFQTLARGAHHALPRLEIAFFVQHGASLVLEEKHILLIHVVIHDVAINGSSTEIKEQFWFGDVCEVLVGIRVENLEIWLIENASVAILVIRWVFPIMATYAIINEIFLFHGVPNGLRSPHGMQVLTVESLQIRKTIWKIDCRMLPMN